MKDNLNAAPVEELVVEFLVYHQVPAPRMLLESADQLWPILSQVHWTARENQPGDYTVLIRGQRRFGVGIYKGKRAAVGRSSSFLRAALIAIVRHNRTPIDPT